MKATKRKPGTVVEAAFSTAEYGQSVKFDPVADVFGYKIAVVNGDAGVLVGAHWVYMLEVQRTIRVSSDLYRHFFKVRHVPSNDVCAAVEACIMADEYDAAVRIALDDWMVSREAVA